MSQQLGVVALVATVALTSGATVAVTQGMLGVMQGTVTDEESGLPLADATIRLSDSARGRTFSTNSGKNGRFYKRGIPGAMYAVVVEKDGYKPLEENLRIASGSEHRFDFKLAKAAPEGAKEFGEGIAAFGRGDNEAAALAFEAAVQKAPKLPEVRVNLALAYLRLSRMDDAVAQLEQAVALAPDDARTLLQLGGAYVEFGDLDKACAVLEKGLEKQPDLANATAFEATVTLGAVYFAKGEIEKSIAQFEKVLAVSPAHVVSTLGLAKAHLSNGDAHKAVELFAKIVSSAPDTPEAATAETFLAELGKASPSQP